MKRTGVVILKENKDKKEIQDGDFYWLIYFLFGILIG